MTGRYFSMTNKRITMLLGLMLLGLVAVGCLDASVYAYPAGTGDAQITALPDNGILNPTTTPVETTIAPTGTEVVDEFTLPMEFTGEGYNYKTIMLRWKAVPQATGYIIYRSNNEEYGYKKIKEIKRSSTVTFKDKKCKAGVVYFYKIFAYRGSGVTYEISEDPEPAASATLLKAPKLKSAKPYDAETVYLTWRKVTGAKGYAIYRSTSKNGAYKIIDYVTSPSASSAYLEDQENGYKYFYKIRAYANKKKKATWSDFSNIKSAKFDMLASSNETSIQKAKRIFGTSYYQKYSSQQEAESHMTTIKIAVWDFGSDGTKVTKYLNLTVHENIAPTVSQIFKEIYEGEEKFPIKNIGGYSYRGDTSNSEHCEGLAIDINWEENALIDNGTVITGNYYKPGEDPYSIPTDGEVAKIMKKYGFSQGLWGNRCDYMHFSYFGG